MKLCLIKVAKSDACIRPLFANPVTNGKCVSTLLAKQNASVLKVGMPCHAGCEAYKRRLAYSVTVGILAQNNFIYY